MDKVIEALEVTSSEVRIIDRKKVILTGLKKLISFDPEEFLMETNLGTILLKGEGLEIIKLDTVDGSISIKGRVLGYNYIEGNVKNKNNGLVAKLFK